MTAIARASGIHRRLAAAVSFLACAVALIGAGRPAHAEQLDSQRVALFKNVTGNIVVERSNEKLVATPAMTLHVSDKLVSSPGASAGVVFNDGTLLTVGPASEIELRDYVFEPKEAKFAFSVYLAKGSAIYSSGKIGKVSPESVRVDTPTATVGVRGTRFLIEAQ